MFPRPTSSRTLVRGTLAATIEELGHIFAGEVEAFLAEEARARKGHLEKVVFVGEHVKENVPPKEKRVRKIAKKVLTVSVCVFRCCHWMCAYTPDATVRHGCKALRRRSRPQGLNLSCRMFIIFGFAVVY